MMWRRLSLYWPCNVQITLFILYESEASLQKRRSQMKIPILCEPVMCFFYMILSNPSPGMKRSGWALPFVNVSYYGFPPRISSGHHLISVRGFRFRSICSSTQISSSAFPSHHCASFHCPHLPSPVSSNICSAHVWWRNLIRAGGGRQDRVSGGTEQSYKKWSALMNGQWPWEQKRKR